MAKPNRWVDFIRKWAKDNDTTYSCALSNPKCKDAYRAKYGIKKAVPARTERERMGLEDVNVGKKKPRRFKDIAEEVIAAAKAKPDKPPKKKKKKLLIIEDDLERAEREQMGSEDINRAEEPLRVKRITIDGVVYLVDKATRTRFFTLKEPHDPIEDPRKTQKAAEKKSRKAAKAVPLPDPTLESEREDRMWMDSGTADQISNDIMMSMPKPNTYFTEYVKKQELAHLDKIEEIIKNSLYLKRITKKEAAALRGEKGLAFVRGLVNKSKSTPDEPVTEDSIKINLRGDYERTSPQILDLIMNNMPNPNFTYTLGWKKEAFKNLKDIIVRVIPPSVKMKLITREEAQELRNKRDKVNVAVAYAVKLSGGYSGGGSFYRL